MDLRQLRYFVTVAEEKNITAAAKKLYISQPPLSTQLHQLEQELGCVLFERGPRRIQLTEAGRMLYNRATAILQLTEQAQMELRDYTGGIRGTLRFGAVSSVSGTVLTEWISSFHDQFPEVQFELQEGNTYQLLEQVRTHRIELAIIRTPFQANGMKQYPLEEEPMLAAGHRRYFAKSDEPTISLAQLAAQPLIMYRRWAEIVASLFEQLQLRPLYFCKNDDARTTALWADAGLGVGLLPRSARSLLHHPETIFREIAEPRLRTAITIVRSRETYLSAIGARFISHIRQNEALRSNVPIQSV